MYTSHYLMPSLEKRKEKTKKTDPTIVGEFQVKFSWTVLWTSFDLQPQKLKKEKDWPNQNATTAATSLKCHNNRTLGITYWHEKATVIRASLLILGSIGQKTTRQPEQTRWNIFKYTRIIIYFMHLTKRLPQTSLPFNVMK